MSNELIAISKEVEKRPSSYIVEGDDFQNVRFQLQPGESMVVDSGALIARDPYVKMDAQMVGGITKSLRRMIGGESVFIPKLTNESTGIQEVIFGSNFPGKVVVMDIGKYGQEGFNFQPGAFIASAGDVSVDFRFPGFGAGLFGGEGLFFQKVTGEGDVFVQAPGNLIERDLKEGEEVVVSTGHLVGYGPGVNVEIRRVGGIKTMLLGGQGFFDTVLRGPGKIMIQSSIGMPIAPAMSSGASSGSGQLIGGLVDGIIGR